MQGPDGTFFKSDPGGNLGVMTSAATERQKLTVTIPKFWAEETYTLSGAIQAGGLARRSDAPRHHLCCGHESRLRRAQDGRHSQPSAGDHDPGRKA